MTYSKKDLITIDVIVGLGSDTLVGGGIVVQGGIGFKDYDGI